MKHFYLILLSLCLLAFSSQAQHLPKLSDLGLIEIESVTVMVHGSKSDYPEYFNLQIENGYVTSGSLNYSDDKTITKMSLSNNPLVLTYKWESDGGLSYENATMSNFIFNTDGTVKQYTIDYDSYFSRYGKEAYDVPVKLYYDTEKHLTKVESKFCDIENEWVEGNLHRQIAYRKYTDGSYSLVSVFTYGQDINSGVAVSRMESSITLGLPLDDMGVFGRQSKNLPIKKQYRYSDENVTHSVDYKYQYDNHNRLIEICDTRNFSKSIKYSSDNAIEIIKTQSTTDTEQIYGLHGSFEPLSKGIRIIKKADGTNQIVLFMK